MGRDEGREREEDRSILSRLTGREGEVVSPKSFWEVYELPPAAGAGVGPGGGEEGTEEMGLGPMVLPERGRI